VLAVARHDTAVIGSYPSANDNLAPEALAA
jgi:hypothetical protein